MCPFLSTVINILEETKDDKEDEEVTSSSSDESEKESKLIAGIFILIEEKILMFLFRVNH